MSTTFLFQKGIHKETRIELSKEDKQRILIAEAMTTVKKIQSLLDEVDRRIQSK